MKDIFPRCPVCKNRFFVGKVRSYDLIKSRFMSAYFCSNCLTEFDKDRTVMQPLLGEEFENDISQICV